MASYYDLISSRTTLPDSFQLTAALRLIEPTAGYSQTDLTHFRVKTNTPLSPANITAAQNAIDTAPTKTPQNSAQAWVDNMPLEEKAILLSILDQLNVLRTKAGLATISVNQAIQAVRDKAGTL